MRLLPGENVEWATRRGVFSNRFLLAVLGILGGPFLAFVGLWGLWPLFLIGVVMFLGGLIYATISSVVAKSTKYVLTNQRIVETRFGRVVRQIPLSSFMGRPVSHFLDKYTIATVNNQPVYNVRITDPKTVDVMELNTLNNRAEEQLERILERASQIVLCKYCNTKNSANSSVCSNCGAPL